MDVGEIINGFSDYRRENNLTIRQAAMEIGVSYGYLARVENRMQNPSMTLLEKMYGLIIRKQIGNKDSWKIKD